jgi:hypothetical protein
VLPPLTPIHHALLPPQLPPLLFHRQHHLLPFPCCCCCCASLLQNCIDELASTLGYYLSAPLFRSFLSLNLKPPVSQIILNNLITPQPNFILLFLIPLPPLSTTPFQSLPLKIQTPTQLRPCHHTLIYKSKKCNGYVIMNKILHVSCCTLLLVELDSCCTHRCDSLLFTFAP